MRRCLAVCFAYVAGFIWLHGPTARRSILTGPKVDVHVKRGDVTLPIGQVPNLLPGDRLWIHPDFPESQSDALRSGCRFPARRHQSSAAGLVYPRGNLDPGGARTKASLSPCPQEAQQALVFLAPETGGDFSTLRKAVHDRPGAFVRAAQDLQAASWDRMRLDAYLNEVKVTSQTDPKALKERAEMAARIAGNQARPAVL